MKTFACYLLIATLLVSFSSHTDTISKKEKKFAAKYLKQSRDGVEKSVRGLSEAQLKFKPNAESWSVEECLKHIAITEQMLWGMAAENLKLAATPEKRSDIKWTDEQVIEKVEDRTNKVKTFDPMKPENTPYKSAEGAIASFKQDREKLIDFIKNTEDDLRNHVLALPFTSVDGYQFLLFIAAHTNRHVRQIEEVKASPGFPASN